MILNNQLSVIMLAEPGYFRDGIVSILHSYDVIGAVGVSSLKNYLEVGNKTVHPDIILINCIIDHLFLETVTAIRNKNPNCLLITIVENTQKVQTALKYGANAAIVEGFTRQNLLDIICDFFNQPKIISDIEVFNI